LTYDQDNSGYLDRNEMITMLKNSQLIPFSDVEEYLDYIIDYFDENLDGQISQQELLDKMLPVLQNKEEIVGDSWTLTYSEEDSETGLKQNYSYFCKKKL